jgi:hypothetical protein
MVPESQLESTKHGLVANADWFVINAHDARWWHIAARSAICDHEGERDFPQLGINVSVLAPGAAIAMYHREAD